MSDLLARRRFADAAPEHADAALHREAVVGILILISIHEVPDGIEMTIPHTLSNLDRGKGLNSDAEGTGEDPATEDVEAGAEAEVKAEADEDILAVPTTPSGLGKSVLYSWGAGSSGALLQ